MTPRGRQVSPRAATFLLFVVNGAVVGTWVAAIPGIKASLGASATQMGLVLFSASVGALISQQVTGQLLVRASSRRVLTAAALIFPLLTVLPMLAPDALVLAAVMVAFAAFNTLMDVAMNAHGVALESSGGRSIFSGLHAGWSLGGIIGAVGVGARHRPRDPGRSGSPGGRARSLAGLAGREPLHSASARRGPREPAASICRPGPSCPSLSSSCSSPSSRAA